MYELKMTTQNIKGELNKDMENFRKKNQTEILGIKSPFSQTKNTVESHSSNLEQVDDRISEIEDKIEMQEKTEEILVKQFKRCESNVQELSDSIKRPNLRIMGVEEGEAVQVKRIHNTFNKIITKTSQILRKFYPVRYRKPPGHQT
jgi:chromosome segregation ATPase